MIEWLKTNKVYVVLGCLLTSIVGLYIYSQYDFQSIEASDDIWDPSSSLEVDNQEHISTSNEQTSFILIDVKGAVNKPGVYEAVEGDRVIDLIEKAGGLRKTANELAVNFAMKVTDEMVLYIPEKGKESSFTTTSSVLNSSGETKNDKINLNTATQSDLLTLPGIGPSKADAILKYREENGPFKTVEDLTSVTGIGDKTFEKLKDQLTVK
ncbi:helix-hairpin-helix domain-containing protein (plasmid) [Bacillus sp. 31A1R]|uniref:Helix-hairpin-helix domain-containing protein n=1 Tax=Robertmurraya mangrovi TaxID=3098077 RepID=A0ABU5IUU5_9BACI|nr:helix-hairpin-helix domain-containing protein [Bacillus sp. 31A1R]MDZ5470916.1 helix-hairpin-helix domain-containing protein [Bacillus sp. 31A1R]